MEPGCISSGVEQSTPISNLLSCPTPSDCFYSSSRFLRPPGPGPARRWRPAPSVEGHEPAPHEPHGRHWTSLRPPQATDAYWAAPQAPQATQAQDGPRYCPAGQLRLQTPTMHAVSLLVVQADTWYVPAPHGEHGEHPMLAAPPHGELAKVPTGHSSHIWHCRSALPAQGPIRK